MAPVTTGKTRLIKAINYGRISLKMDTDAWQRYLKTHIYKARNQDLADAMPDVDLAALGTLQLNKLLDQMRRDGYGRKEAAKEKQPEQDPHAVLQRGLIRALWLGMYRLSFVKNKSKESLDGYCLRICRKSLDNMGVGDCQKLIETLKKWWLRKASPEQADWLADILNGRMAVEELPDGSVLVGGMRIGG